MKFPSIKNLAESAGKTIKRFPFELLFALAGTIAATFDIEKDNLQPADQNWCYRIIMTANLGLLLCLATTLFTEGRMLNKRNGYLVRILVALAATSLLFLLNPDERLYDNLRFFLFSLSFHLLVSFAAFFPNGQVQGFWQFNKAIFLRFLTSILYSGVLYIGLIAAINGAIFLFNLKLDPHINSTLFVWIAGIFNTLFFLSGVPKDIGQLSNDFSYPKGLKIFTQYVLIPLAAVYVIILLAYEVKILIQWSLPKGLVSSLIMSYAVFGILSILLVYPIRETQENKWIKTWGRSFYILLIPLNILLLLAVFARVFPYGITVPRYFLLVLSAWLFFITVYFLFSKKQNIKVIPVSLCLLTLISIYGPLSTFSVSEYSQRYILINLFKKYGNYKDGKLLPMTNKRMTEKDGSEAIAKIQYLVDGKNMSSLQEYISKDLSAVNDSLRKTNNDKSSVYFYLQGIKSSEADWIVNYLGLDKFSKVDQFANVVSYDFDTDNNVILNVKSYDYVTRVDDGFSNTDTTFLNEDRTKIKQLSDSTYNCKLYVNNELAIFDLKQIADSLIKHKTGLKAYNQLPDSKDSVARTQIIMIYRQTQNYHVTFAISKLDVNYSKNKVSNVSEVMGYYLIKKK